MLPLKFRVSRYTAQTSLWGKVLELRFRWVVIYYPNPYTIEIITLQRNSVLIVSFYQPKRS